MGTKIMSGKNPTMLNKSGGRECEEWGLGGC